MYSIIGRFTLDDLCEIRLFFKDKNMNLYDNLKLYIISEKVLDILGERVVEVPVSNTATEENESEEDSEEETQS